MSRVILLLILAVWLVGAEELQRTHPTPHGSIQFFFAGYLAILIGVAIWARFVARRAISTNFRRLFRQFNTAVQIIRWLIPGWMIVDIVGGGAWAQWVLNRFAGERFDVPAMVV